MNRDNLVIVAVLVVAYFAFRSVKAIGTLPMVEDELSLSRYLIPELYADACVTPGGTTHADTDAARHDPRLIAIRRDIADAPNYFNDDEQRAVRALLSVRSRFELAYIACFWRGTPGIQSLGKFNLAERTPGVGEYLDAFLWPVHWRRVMAHINALPTFDRT